MMTPRSAKTVSLTAHQTEIPRLLVKRLIDREIAAALPIS